MKAKEEHQGTGEAQDEEEVETSEETGNDTGIEEGLNEKVPEEVAQAEGTMPPEKEEEAKPVAKKKTEEEVVEERIYTIPLSKAWISPPKKRSPRAMHIIEAFITKHMKLNVRVDEEEEETKKKLVITNEVNEKVWDRGIEKPPRKIRVRATKDKEGKVTVYLAEGD
jgi:large subunit ribosomal protein L31e